MESLQFFHFIRFNLCLSVSHSKTNCISLSDFGIEVVVTFIENLKNIYTKVDFVPDPFFNAFFTPNKSAQLNLRMNSMPTQHNNGIQIFRPSKTTI